MQRQDRMRHGAGVMDEIELVIRPPLAPALGTEEQWAKVWLEAGVVDAESPGERHQIDAGGSIASTAVYRQFLAGRDHIANGAHGERIGDVGNAEHGRQHSA